MQRVNYKIKNIVLCKQYSKVCCEDHTCVQRFPSICFLPSYVCSMSVHTFSKDLYQILVWTRKLVFSAWICTYCTVLTCSTFYN